MSEPALLLDHVSKRYRLYQRRHQSLKEILVRRSLGEWRDLWALDDVSFEVPEGQVLGIVGENGSGKSTLLKILSGIIPPDRGQAAVRGRVASLLELGAGFQPEYTGRENIYLYGALLGLRRSEIEARVEDIIAFSELGSRVENPVKNYSSGMYMRLGFSVAVHLDPDILLIDEVLAVGDAAFQRKCYEHLRTLRRNGCTIVLVSHDLEAVGKFCERAIWLDRGKLAADGPVQLTIERYLDLSARRASERSAVETPDVEQAPGDVRLTGARMLDARGAETRQVSSGDEVTIELTYEARRDVANVAINVTLFRNDGVRILDAPSNVNGGHAIREGEGVARVRFPRLSLHGGTYSGTLAAYDADTGRPYDHHDRVLPFTVIDPDDGSAVVWLDYQWELKDVVDAAREAG